MESPLPLVPEVEDNASVMEREQKGKHRFDDYFVVLMKASDPNQGVAMTATNLPTDTAITVRIALRMRHVPVPSNHRITSMAMTIKSGKLILFYNLGWMADVNFQEWVTTLTHEVYHVVKRDVPAFYRRLAAQPEHARQAAHQLLNIALDASNNQELVKRNPHMKFSDTGTWILPKPLGWEEDDVVSEEYWETLWINRKRILDAAQELMDNPDGIGGYPKDGTPSEKLAWQVADKFLNNAHPWTDPTGGTTAQELRDSANAAMSTLADLSDVELEALATDADQTNKSAIKAALKDYQKSIGNLPSHWASVLEAVSGTAQVKWTRVLRRVIGSQAGGHRVHTVNQSSRRNFVTHRHLEDGSVEELELPLPVKPGNTRDHRHLILFAIDTSGSMSNRDVIEGLVELKKLKKDMPDITVIVVQCDTHISHVCEMDESMSVEAYVEKVGRTSGGGTSFRAPFAIARHIASPKDNPLPPSNYTQVLTGLAQKYARVDMVVYHTDGGGHAPSAAYAKGIQTLWCLPSNNAVMPTFEGGERFGQFVWRHK